MAAVRQNIWELQYQLPPNTPITPGETSVVLVLEQSPAIKLPPLPRGAQTYTVAGRSVILKSAQPGAGGPWTGIWHTSHAYYTVITNGSQLTTLDHFVACLP
jgi:hypothetical protein